jgi:glycosyltransferase involved in cell wall biosynthesis
MRVTHVITRLIVGGAQENTVASVLGLRAISGWNVDLISGPTTGPEGSLESAFSHQPGALLVLPELVRPVHPWLDWRALNRLTSIFRATKPAIVHTHSGKAGVLGRLAAARAGVPVILHTIHGPSFGAFQGRLANGIFLAAERRAAKVTTHFITVANAMRDQYLAAGIGSPAQYTRVFSGFPLQPFQSAYNDPALRLKLGIAPDDVVIGKIARLFKLKGHDDLINIAPFLIENCPKLKFLIVGDGEWRARLEARVRDSGLQARFVFTGLVPPEKVPALVGIMDVLVHLSLREGLPRALPQAMAAGKPVVAYDCDGAKEVCLDNQTGFLIRPGHETRLKESLLQLVNDPALRLRLGTQGRAFVSEHFAVEQMVSSLAALYQRVWASSGRGLQAVAVT